MYKVHLHCLVYSAASEQWDGQMSQV